MVAKEIIGNPNLEKPNNEEVKSTYKSAKKCFPQKNKIIPYGVDEKPTDYSNQLHPKGDLNGIKLNKTDDIISLFRKKIITRGLIWSCYSWLSQWQNNTSPYNDILTTNNKTSIMT